MGNIFTGSELVEIGIEIEKNGRDFYSILSNQSKNQQAQGMFQFLAKEEEKHIAVFQGILDAVEKYQPPESYPGEYFAYMTNLASEYVFTQKDKGKEIAKKTTSDLEAIELGINFEKDSIIFYEGMKKVIPQFDLKIVEQLVAQEEQHLKMLFDFKHGLIK